MISTNAGIHTGSVSLLLVKYWAMLGISIALLCLGASLLFWQGSWIGILDWAVSFYLISLATEIVEHVQSIARRRPTLFGALLYAITGLLRCRVISGPEGEPYLERYALFQIGPIRAFVHRFVASDPDRGLHDHPWGHAVSLILSGNYSELRMAGNTVVSRTVSAGDLNFLLGTDFHRVVLPSIFDTWSLFIHGPRIKGWGFIKQGNAAATYTEVDARAESHKSKGWAQTAPIGWRANRTPLALETR